MNSSRPITDNFRSDLRRLYSCCHGNWGRIFCLLRMHETLTQCWTNVGPASGTLANISPALVQRTLSSGRPILFVCWLPIYQSTTGVMILWPVTPITVKTFYNVIETCRISSPGEERVVSTTLQSDRYDLLITSGLMIQMCSTCNLLFFSDQRVYIVLC